MCSLLASRCVRVKSVVCTRAYKNNSFICIRTSGSFTPLSVYVSVRAVFVVSACVCVCVRAFARMCVCVCLWHTVSCACVRLYVCMYWMCQCLWIMFWQLTEYECWVFHLRTRFAFILCVSKIHCKYTLCVWNTTTTTNGNSNTSNNNNHHKNTTLATVNNNNNSLSLFPNERKNIKTDYSQYPSRSNNKSLN